MYTYIHTYLHAYIHMYVHTYVRTYANKQETNTSCFFCTDLTCSCKDSNSTNDQNGKEESNTQIKDACIHTYIHAYLHTYICIYTTIHTIYIYAEYRRYGRCTFSCTTFLCFVSFKFCREISQLRIHILEFPEKKK